MQDESYERLKAQIRETPLLDRLSWCRRRIAEMTSERRPPSITIPPNYRDDDIFMTVTFMDAVTALSPRGKEIRTETDEGDAIRVDTLEAL